MKDIKLTIAILVVAIVWGTTFLGIRVAVETIPGWFVAGIRQMIAGIIMFLILIFRNEFRWIGWKNLGYQLIFSILMLIGANGLTTVAEETLTSSLASLLSATTPILVFIGSIFIGLEKFSYKGLLGIILCFSGILFIFWDGVQDLAKPDYLNGILLMLGAISGWALGTLFTKKLNVKGDNISLNLFYQFIFAGIAQIGLAFIFSENYNFGNWSLKSITAMLYLATFGSVIAFFSFHYALSKISPNQVSILTYINTIIAIILGWLILDEVITLKFILATLLIISGVFITNYKSSMLKRR